MKNGSPGVKSGDPLFLSVFFKCLCELIRTGSTFAVAVYPFQPLYHFIDLHSLDKFADALKISVAAAHKADVADYIAVKIEPYLP